jgi:hypothetical protein
MSKTASYLWLASVVFLSAAGLAFSIWLIIINFNLYWLIFSPVNIALSQAPAVLLFRLWKKNRQKGQGQEESAPDGI